MKVDVVYPLANKSRNKDDWELRYSLRSLQLQNWVRHVILVGHCPQWVNARAIHIPCPDPYINAKDANIINKIMMAAGQFDISTDFVVNSDDQIFLREVELDELEPKVENPCRLDEFKRRSQINAWYRRNLDTIGWCHANGYPEWILQSHMPYIVNKHQYAWAMAHCPWGTGKFTTHVFFNVLWGLKDYVRPDSEKPGTVARIKQVVNKHEFEKQMTGASFLNFNDAGWPVIREYIENLFPVPSRWER